MIGAIRRMFGRKDSRPDISYTFTDEQPVEVDVPEHEEYDITLAIPLRTISGLFADRGWSIMRPGFGDPPGPHELAALMVDLITNLNAQDAQYSTFARFLVIHDEDFPGDTDVYLFVGTASPKIEDDETDD